MICFYTKKQEQWEQEEFQSSHGTLMEEYKLNGKLVPKKLILILILSFFLRRLIFVLVIFYLEDLSFQLFVQMGCTMGILVMLLSLKPYASPKGQRLEVFNELTILALNYVLFFFTDVIESA